MSATTFPIDARLQARVSEELRVELARRRWSVRQLAVRVGVNQAWMHRRISGGTSLTIDELRRVCDALELRMSDFMLRVESPRPGTDPAEELARPKGFEPLTF